MIAVCLKWVERRPEVDPFSGKVATDPRTSGASDADLAALEWALRLADAWGDEVVAATAGPAGADPVLRDALAVGAARGVRVDLPLEAPSAAVAAGLVHAVGDAPVVVCGDWSMDRGSGSVPAFLAARIGAAQALGLVSLAFDEDHPGAVRAERRLDGGRRERLRIVAPMVLSVEGSTRPRRASLEGVLRAREAAMEVMIPAVHADIEHPIHVGPYRPRARVLPGPSPALPARERMLALSGALVDRTPPERVVLDPPDAAERLLAQLHAWGFLEP